MKFHYIDVLLDMLYGIELDSEDIEELGLLGWNLIGNKNVKLCRFSSCIDPKDNSITLPCNAIPENGVVEAVTSSFEDWQRVTNHSDYGDTNTAFVELYIEAQKSFTSDFYMSGKLLNYRLNGNKLYFNRNYGTVNVLYKGYLMDEDGLPEISEKEANALATYIAYVTKLKESLVTNNQNLLNQANILKVQWTLQCDLARITYLNLNDMNNIINIKNSFNRSWYGKSFKPIP